MQLPDALDGFLLEFLRGGGEVGVFVAEQLVADLAGQQDADVGLLVDGLADQIHAHAGADGGDVIGAQQLDHRLQRGAYLIRRHIHLGVVAADIVGHLPRVFQVDGVLAHADGEGADGLVGAALRHSAHQRGIQSAAEEEAHLGIGHQPLLDAGDQLLVNVGAHGVHIIAAHLLHGGDVPITDELSVCVVVSGRERHDFAADAHKVFRLTGKNDGAGIVVAVVERTDADGVAGGDKGLLLRVVQDQGELGVQHAEHVGAVLPVEGKQNLAVGFAAEGIALCQQLPLQRLKAVDLAVADHIAAVQCKGLHAGRLQTHDGQPVEAQQPVTGVNDPAVVGATGQRLVKARLKKRKIGIA